MFYHCVFEMKNRLNLFTIEKTTEQNKITTASPPVTIIVMPFFSLSESTEERNSIMMAHKTARLPKRGTYDKPKKVEV